MTKEVESTIEIGKPHFQKGHKEGFSNTKLTLLAGEEIDISLTRGNSHGHKSRGKHRSLVRGAYALYVFRKGGWRI
jgi:hypothetical protein